MPWSDRCRGGGRRAVTELVGYLLIFAVVIGGTVLVSTAGLSLLAETGGDAREVAEREFDRLGSGVEAVLDGAPHRDLRLDPRDGALEAGDAFTVTVTASGGGVTLTGGDAVTVSGEAIRYDLDGGTLTYVAGLIAYHQPGSGGALARGSPDLRVSADQLVLVVPATAANGSERVAAERGGSIPVVLEQDSARVVRRVATTPGGNATNLTGTVRVSGPAAGAWGRVFADRPGFAPTDLDGDGDTEYAADTDGDGRREVAGAAFETHRLYVRAVDVGVRLGSRLRDTVPRHATAPRPRS